MCSSAACLWFLGSTSDFVTKDRWSVIAAMAVWKHWAPGCVQGRRKARKSGANCTGDSYCMVAGRQGNHSHPLSQTIQENQLLTMGIKWLVWHYQCLSPSCDELINSLRVNHASLLLASYLSFIDGCLVFTHNSLNYYRYPHLSLSLSHW